MWRECTKCKSNFFQGGVKVARGVCPECRYELKRQARIRKSNNKTHSVEKTFITNQGRVIGSKVNYPKITCGFCKEIKKATRVNALYCISCDNLRPSNKHDGLNCKACNAIYWGSKRNKIHYCSPSCKEVLREYHECVVCAARIAAEKRITTMYCSIDCRRKLTVINNLRKERDGKGAVFTPEIRYKKIFELGVSNKILDEFRRDLDESKNNNSR